MSAKPTSAVQSATASSAVVEPARPVGTSKCQREVCLLKVPDVLSDLIRRCGSSGVALGSIEKSTAPVAGVKRGRNALHLVLDKSSLEHVLGKDQAAVTPLVYNVTLSEQHTPDTRILHTFDTGAIDMFGIATQTGQLAPDVMHKSYTAYSTHRRKLEKQAAAARQTTELAPDGTFVGITSTVDNSQLKDMFTRDAPTSRVAAAGLAGAVRSIFDLFEVGAYWSIKELSEATGRKETELRPEVQECCDYIKSGPNRGKHRLKPEFRSAKSVPPDENDGIPTE